MEKNSFNLAIISLSVKSLTLSDFSNLLEKFVKESKEKGASLILFPEFSIAPILGAMDGDAIEATYFLEQEIKKLAELYSIYICGGTGAYLIEGLKYNQALFVNPKGEVIYQPKINLILSEKADEYCGGSQIKIITTPFAKLAILVCYDIEFPELVRQAVLAGARLILNPSYTIDQYGEKRVQFCAQARTIENHIYVAKSCLVGEDGYAETPYGFGKSALYTPIDYGFNKEGIAAETSSSTGQEVLLVKVDFDKLNILKNKASTAPLEDYCKNKIINFTLIE